HRRSAPPAPGPCRRRLRAHRSTCPCSHRHRSTRPYRPQQQPAVGARAGATWPSGASGMDLFESRPRAGGQHRAPGEHCGAVDVAAAATTGVPARPFVGRARELEELVAALEDAAAGNGSLLLLTGEAGIGKTRLMQVFGGLAGERGWQVLLGRCWEEGGAPAYWPWIQVVRDAGGDFERLAEPPSETGQAPGDPESVRFRLFDAATRYLVESARQH